MGVKRESGAYFFRQMSAPVMTGGEFEVHASPLSIPSFVFDPNVRHRNLSSNDLKSMLLRDGVFAIGGITVFAELREIAIEVLLQFVVENDSKVSASLALDLFGCLLIEPVEVGIVMGFAGFGESVVKGLPFISALGF